jgi:hypothetical protein
MMAPEGLVTFKAMVGSQRKNPVLRTALPGVFASDI